MRTHYRCDSGTLTVPIATTPSFQSLLGPPIPLIKTPPTFELIAMWLRIIPTDTSGKLQLVTAELAINFINNTGVSADVLFCPFTFPVAMPYTFPAVSGELARISIASGDFPGRQIFSSDDTWAGQVSQYQSSMSAQVINTDGAATHTMRLIGEMVIDSPAEGH